MFGADLVAYSSVCEQQKKKTDELKEAREAFYVELRVTADSGVIHSGIIFTLHIVIWSTVDTKTWIEAALSTGK